MRMRLVSTGLLVFTTCLINAQSTQKLPEFSLKSSEPEAHLRFLAADELLGRRTGEPGNQKAAEYIAQQFKKVGAKPAVNGSYFQPVALETIYPSTQGTITTTEGTAKVMDDFVMMSNVGVDLPNAEIVYLPYGWVDTEKGYDDFAGVDVKGKVLVVGVGFPDSKSPQDMFGAMEDKAKWAQEKGAKAIIEVFNSPIPWRNIAGYFGRKSTRLVNKTTDTFPHLWISSAAAKILAKNKVTQASLSISAPTSKPLNSSNVIGVIEGTDPKLKNEYVVLSAHYDHVGTGKENGRVTATDTIFNGARDNAFGTTAVLTAAKALAQEKTKRSILLIAYTGEEIGLLGSKFYSENPVIPLNQCIYNLNCDGAGYNDTSLLTIIGLSRTSGQDAIQKAATAFGLKAVEDPAPEQNLFDRSDNVSLAAKGIPAPTFSPGFSAFDDKINQYYHQVADDADSVDFSYLLKYCQSYTYAARLIANDVQAPVWKSGDKYEKAFQKLYGK